jgi:RNA polymerase sigma-70 factor (ECF subfamily)
MPSQTDETAAQERQISQNDDAFRALLIATAAGCMASFTQLYSQTHRRVFGIVLRIVKHRAEAEDILQEVYVKVWSRSTQFDPHRGQAAHWLAGIAHCAALDALRRRESRPREVHLELDDDGPYWQLASSEPGPADQLEEAETRLAIQRELSTLPDDQRESLALAFFDGLTHAEIATRLCCPLGTIKSRVRRALMSLRSGLQFAH